MKPKLIKNLEDLKHKIKLTSAQKNEMKEILMSKISKNYLTSENKIPLLTKLVDLCVPAFDLKPVGVFIMILCLILGSTLGTVSASKNTLPGNPLYGVKITVENVKYNLTFSDEGKVSLAMASAQNRVDELKQIVEQDSSGESVIVTSNHLQDSLNKVKEKMVDIKDKEVESTQDAVIIAETIKKIDESLSQVESGLAETKEKLDEESKNQLVAAENEIDKTSAVVLAALIETSEDGQAVEEIQISKDELNAKVQNKLNKLQDRINLLEVSDTLTSEIQNDLNSANAELQSGNLNSVIDNILSINEKLESGSETEIIIEETEVVEEGTEEGVVKGEEDENSEIVSKNNSSTQIIVPFSVLEILGIQEEPELQEFGVGLK